MTPLAKGGKKLVRCLQLQLVTPEAFKGGILMLGPERFRVHFFALKTQ